MTDERKQAEENPCMKCTYNGHTTICEQCNDGNDYEHFVYNDPYSKESMDFFKLFIKARKELCSKSQTETYSLEEAIRKAFDAALKVAEATKEMYPKRFIVFCNDNFYWDKVLSGYLPTTKKYQGVIFKTTDELFEFWEQNIQGK